MLYIQRFKCTAKHLSRDILVNFQVICSKFVADYVKVIQEYQVTGTSSDRYLRYTLQDARTLKIADAEGCPVHINQKALHACNPFI